MPEPEDRPLAEDFSCPVVVEPGVDSANPPDWNWRLVGTSQPNRATFHINHSDVTRVMVDVLQPSDSPPEAQFVLSREIPIIVIDSLDNYWASESKPWLPLNGVRVPVEGETLEEAKSKLAADLSAQLRLLLLLSSSHQREIAAPLRENLARLRSVLTLRSEPGKQQGEQGPG